MENVFCAYICGQQLLLDQAITGHLVEPTGSLNSSSWLVLCYIISTAFQKQVPTPVTLQQLHK